VFRSATGVASCDHIKVNASVKCTPLQLRFLEDDKLNIDELMRTMICIILEVLETASS